MKFLIYLLSFFLISCAGNKEPQIEKAPVPLLDESHPQVSVLFTQQNIAKAIEIQDKTISYENGLMLFNATVMNTSNKKQTFSYKMEWKDRFNRPLSAEITPNFSMELGENEKIIINAATKDQKASKLKLTIYNP
jgi:uncharacterized protein YcfL